MYIFVLNCGSTTFKYQLIDMSNEKILVKGLVENINLASAKLTYKNSNICINRSLGKIDHKTGIETVFSLMQDPDPNIAVLSSLSEIYAIGHRVVHGGSSFTSPVIVDKMVLEDIEKTILLAPLHNPAHITGIKICMKLLPNKKNVAVFDTSYHQSMPAESYRYAIPEKYYTQYQIRKYGFHGTSHHYVSLKTAEMLNIPYNQFNAISCHLGGGASVTAIKNGQSYDTSMGFTPLEGLIMASRSGDIDPSVNYYLYTTLKMSAEEINSVYNSESGMLALSGKSSDFREIQKGFRENDPRCILALNAFIHRLVFYIGGYATLLGRVDAIIFTAGVGENDIEVRKMAAERLQSIGVKIDIEKNKIQSQVAIISNDDSKISLVVMPTNEELMIAIETKNLASSPQT